MNTTNDKNKRILAVIIGFFLVVFASAAFLNSKSAPANVVMGFWNSRVLPFVFQKYKNNTVTAPNNIPLYQPAIDYEQAVVDAVKKTSPAVVSIIISKNVPVIEQCPYNPFGDLPQEYQQFFGGSSDFTQPCNTGKTQLQEIGGGSGFIISSDGLILTNKHVVADTGASYTVLMNDGTKYDAKVLARDPVQDFAVVKIDATDLPTVTLGDSNALALGQTAIAIGNALGEYSNTVSVGVISGLSRTVTAGDPNSTQGEETIHGVIQTDAAINPGNSGGPLLNLRGEVIGINTAIASDAQSIGFAIPINQAKRDISSVKASGEIQTAYLGVRYLAVTADIAKAQSLSVTAGALVRGGADGPAVASGSPAAKAGVQAEDIIVKINGQAIDADHDLGTVISQYNVGDTITLTINRAGKVITIQATLAKRPAGQ
jgi:S1-C subfamily serine protease